ncbi:MAG: HipA domain-containing protein [Alphaproteobacteria bacterium]
MTKARALDVYLNGYEDPIGQLTSDASFNVEFSYETAAPAHGLSLSMPIREEPYRDSIVKAYFEGLLNENNQLDAVIAKHDLDRGDITGILHHIGGDCAGAVSCVPRGEAPAKRPGVPGVDYDLISKTDLEEIVAAIGSGRPLPQKYEQDPSPVAGVQNKIAVTRTPDGQFSLPKPGTGAPTTHIIKIPKPSHPSASRQEVDALNTLRDILDQTPIHPPQDVATAELLEIGDQQCFITKRYDRVFRHGCIYRLHQEDFAQALGLPPMLRYERRGEGGRAFSAKAVGGLLKRCKSPAQSRMQFIALTIANLTLGNNDNHAKNHCLVYAADDKRPSLGPAYDITPCLLDFSLTKDLAFTIGKATKCEEITKQDIVAFLADIGITAAAKKNDIPRLTAGIIHAALQAAADGVHNFQGNDKRPGDMMASQIETIAEALDMPIFIEERDYFGPVEGMGSQS